jgi:hypothetical protein
MIASSRGVLMVRRASLTANIENLQDHVLVSGVVFKYKGKMPDRPADSDAVEAEAYLSSGPSSDTDINLVLEQLPAVTPEAAARFGAPPADASCQTGSWPRGMTTPPPTSNALHYLTGN